LGAARPKKSLSYENPNIRKRKSDFAKSIFECNKLKSDNEYQEMAEEFSRTANPNEQDLIQEYLKSPSYVKAQTITNQRHTIDQLEVSLTKAKQSLAFLLHHYDKETGLDFGVKVLQKALTEEQSRRVLSDPF